MQRIAQLQRTAGNQAVVRLLGGGRTSLTAPSQTTPEVDQPVVQRDLAVQIHSTVADVVGTIEIVGRPSGYWSDTMGDHTTAFAVNVEGIRGALHGKQVADAIEAMKGIVATARKLPGVGWAGTLDQETAATYQAAATKLTRAEANPRTMLELQTLVNAYLKFRELIPGSTIKTKLKTGYFGRGKGESVHLHALVAHEAGQASEPKRLAASITRLFDATGVGMVAAESQRTLAVAMAPGVPDLPALEKAQQLWTQHLATIQMYFPMAYQAAADVLAQTDLAAMIKRQIAEDVRYDELSFASLLQQAVNARSELAKLKVSAKKRKRIMAVDYPGTARYRVEHDRWRAALEEAESWLTSGTAQIDVLKTVDKDTTVTFPTDEYQKLLDIAKTPSKRAVNTGEAEGLLGNLQAKRTAARTNAPQQQAKTADLMDVEQGPDFPDLAPVVPEATPAATPRPGEKRKRGEPDETRSAKTPKRGARSTPSSSGPDAPDKQYFAIQIDLAPNLTVAKMRAGGRPPSPFVGTMGAHTTAWIVHLDHVRAAIEHRTVRTALAAVTDTLLPPAEARYTDTLERKVLVAHRRSLTAARDELFATRDRAAGGSDDPLLLQRYLKDLLTFINYIPGVTLRGKSTLGKGEGEARKTLRTYEQAVAAGESPQLSVEIIVAAIKGLLDARASGDLWRYHLQMVQGAYPYAFKASGLRIPEPATD